MVLGKSAKGNTKEKKLGKNLNLARVSLFYYRYWHR
ncbi:MAG: hypothetical protein JWQ14_3551 [Adhaeribacter sp.]|nr:hypothetical protein [Adhaeribacter sp.]